jgi:WD40 repeat protein
MVIQLFLQGINDLATSPIDPTIMASGSDDSTIRIWSIASAHREQPCLCILAGEGHLAEVLTVVWQHMSDTSRGHITAELIIEHCD